MASKESTLELGAKDAELGDNDRGNYSSTRLRGNLDPLNNFTLTRRSISVPALHAGDSQSLTCHSNVSTFRSCSCKSHPHDFSYKYSDCCPQYKDCNLKKRPRSVGEIYELTKKEQMLDNWTPYTIDLRSYPKKTLNGRKRGNSLGRYPWGESQEQNFHNKRKNYSSLPIHSKLRRVAPSSAISRTSNRYTGRRTRLRPKTGQNSSYAKVIPYSGKSEIEHRREYLERLKKFQFTVYNSLTRKKPESCSNFDSLDRKYQHQWGLLENSSPKGSGEHSDTALSKGSVTNEGNNKYQDSSSAPGASFDIPDNVNISKSRVKLLREKFESQDLKDSPSFKWKIPKLEMAQL